MECACSPEAESHVINDVNIHAPRRARLIDRKATGGRIQLKVGTGRDGTGVRVEPRVTWPAEPAVGPSRPTWSEFLTSGPDGRMGTGQRRTRTERQTPIGSSVVQSDIHCFALLCFLLDWHATPSLQYRYDNAQRTPTELTVAGL